MRRELRHSSSTLSGIRRIRKLRTLKILKFNQQNWCRRGWFLFGLPNNTFRKSSNWWNIRSSLMLRIYKLASSIDKKLIKFIKAKKGSLSAVLMKTQQSKQKTKMGKKLRRKTQKTNTSKSSHFKKSSAVWKVSVRTNWFTEFLTNISTEVKKHCTSSDAYSFV
jgi:hypothetical protein